MAYILIRFVVWALRGQHIGEMVCEFHPQATEEDPCWCMKPYLKDKVKSVQPEKSVG